MEDFTRTQDNDLFERDSNAPTFFVRFSQQNEDYHNQKKGSSLREYADILNGLGSRKCYIQNYGRNSKGYVQQRITITADGNKFIIVLVEVFRDACTYTFRKIQLIDSIDIVKNESIEIECRIVLTDSFQTGNELFGNNFGLMGNVANIISNASKLTTPKKDIKKEQEQKIWMSYIEALKSFIKKKETIWKVKSISKPKMIDKKWQFDIEVDESSVLNDFKDEISSIFQNYLGNHTITMTKKSVIVEFNNYKELSDADKENLSEIAKEHFYALSTDTPVHSSEGSIYFLTDEDQKSAIIRDVEASFAEFDLPLEKNERGDLVFLNDESLNYLSKIVKTKFSETIEVVPSTKLECNLTFSSNVETIKQDLLSVFPDGIEQHGNFIVGSIKRNWVDKTSILDIEGKGLALDSCRITYIPQSFTSDINIEGVVVKDNYYYKIFKSNEVHTSNRIYKELLKQTNTKIVSNYEYCFKLTIDKRLIRDLKAELLNEPQITIDVPKSKIIFEPKSQEEYSLLIDKVSLINNSAIINVEPYKPTARLQFMIDNIDFRSRKFNQLDNALKDIKSKFISYDVSSDYTELEFEFRFRSEDEREQIKDKLNQIVLQYDKILNLEFENTLGKTTYQLDKNEQWEVEKEKEVRRGVDKAEFIYLSEDEYVELNEKILKSGFNAIFKGGKQLGSLIKKDKTKFTLAVIKNDISIFDEIDYSSAKTGYIKPIFIGDNVNIERMRRAMYQVLQPGEKNGYPVNRNLSNFLFDPSYAAETTISLENDIELIVKNLNEKKLNEKQLEAVAKSIAAKDLALIQGPPGTGKTTVIAEIIWQTILRNQDSRILLTSQTNLAVDNALERLSKQGIVRPIRIGAVNKLEEEGKQYSYDRIIDWRDGKEDESVSFNAVNHWIDNMLENCSQDENFLEVVKKWKTLISKKSDNIREEFTKQYLANTNLIAATCSECGNGKRFTETYKSLYNIEKNSDVKFNTVIMDEASKATPPEMIVPLTLGEKMIIIGDHKQLPPMMEENDFVEKLTLIGAQELVKEWEKEDYKISQFEKLFKNAPKSLLSTLDTQFRMHNQIMNTINQFYKDDLKDGLICGIKDTMDIPDLYNKASRYHGLMLEPLINPDTHAIWIDVNTSESGVGTSYENKGEIEAIDLVLKCLKKASGFDAYMASRLREEDKEIGIITFYGPQKGNIDRKIYGHLDKIQKKNFEQNKLNNEYNLPFRINTVDKFQGMERNILIVSTVRNNNRGIFGFAKEIQRINVAFSRAKTLLIVVGCRNFFMQNPNYSESIRTMQYVNVEQLKNLVK